MIPQRLLTLALATCYLAVSTDVYAADYVFNQSDQTLARPNWMSWHDGLNWLNFLPPGERDHAILDANHPVARDNIADHSIPSPHHVYLGDFFKEVELGGGNDAYVPGGDATVQWVQVRNGEWILDFSYHENGIDPQGHDTTGNLIIRPQDVGGGGVLDVGSANVSGLGAEATLDVIGPGTLDVPLIRAGLGLSDRGEINFRDPQTTIITQGLSVGGAGHGVARVSNGVQMQIARPDGTGLGRVSVGTGAGVFDDGYGELRLSGANTVLEAEHLDISNGQLVVENGAAMLMPSNEDQPAMTGRAFLQARSGQVSDHGRILIRGDNSIFQSQFLSLGNINQATLEIEQRGTVQITGDVRTATSNSAQSRVHIKDRNSSWNIGGHATFGVNGSSDVTIDGGRLSVEHGITLAVNDGAVSRLELKDGVLDLHGSGIEFGAGDAQFIFSGGELHDIGIIHGSLEQFAGSLTPGDSNDVTHIRGNYQLHEEAALLLEVSREGDQTVVDGRLNILGSARVAGRLSVRGDGNLGLMPGSEEVVSILTASNGVSGQLQLDTSHLQDGLFIETIQDEDSVQLELYQAYAGDVDGNSLFDTADLVLVFGHGEFEDDIQNNSNWTEGDWSGDGDFTTTDLVLAFQGGSFERPEVASVPEPITNLPSLLLGVAIFLGLRRSPIV